MRVRFSFSSRLARKTRKPDNINQHKVAFVSQIQNIIRTSDIILEVLDARFIDKTRNLQLENEIKQQNKKLIYVLNKADLVDVNEIKRNYDLESIKPYVFFSSKNKIGRSRLREVISIESKRVKAKEVRIGVIGYPNTGKSTLINVLVGGKRAGTSSKAGFTKNVQKIRLKSNILIFDSPGVITNNEENSINEAIIKKHTEIGAKDYHRVKYPELTVKEIMNEDPKIFDNFYNLDSGGDVENLLENLGKRWNFLIKGGEIDQDRTARKILKDWQEGKIKK